MTKCRRVKRKKNNLPNESKTNSNSLEVNSKSKSNNLDKEGKIIIISSRSSNSSRKRSRKKIRSRCRGEAVIHSKEVEKMVEGANVDVLVVISRVSLMMCIKNRLNRIREENKKMIGLSLVIGEEEAEVIAVTGVATSVAATETTSFANPLTKTVNTPPKTHSTKMKTQTHKMKTLHNKPPLNVVVEIEVVEVEEIIVIIGGEDSNNGVVDRIIKRN